MIPIKSIKENPHQPRKIFDPKKLEEMVNSIREKGIITPITVQEENGSFILIAGERRLRPAKLAKLKMVNILLRDIWMMMAWVAILLKSK